MASAFHALRDLYCDFTEVLNHAVKNAENVHRDENKVSKYTFFFKHKLFSGIMVLS